VYIELKLRDLLDSGQLSINLFNYLRGNYKALKTALVGKLSAN